MRILYVEGDPNAYKFVQGTLEALGHEVVRAPLKGTPQEPDEHDLCILSDRPADELGDAWLSSLADAVEAGTGLLVVGGWKSYGRGGYARTPLARLLPVEMKDGDDRRNLPQGALLAKATDHPVLEGLDFVRPAVIAGVNAVRPQAGARVVMEALPIERVEEGRVHLARERLPVLLLAESDRARVAALLTDLAPHWSGGLSDWGGDPRDVGNGEQVGAHYWRLLEQLCEWLVRIEPRRREEARA